MAAEQIWTPDPARAEASAMAQFARWVKENRGVATTDYAELHDWSVRDLAGFWSAVAEFAEVPFHDPPSEIIADKGMPGTRWFPGATLNYAEIALGSAEDDATALIFVREDGTERTVSYGELREQVARARAGLIALGVRRGDRVVALAPNCVETVVAFLATASLGALWSSCSPDFGPRAVHDRFAQIEPTVLLAVDGYRYNGKAFDIRATVNALRDQLPTLRGTVLLGYLDPNATLDGAVSWAEFTADKGELVFDPVPFDHPLWILYSSGTTGLPKGIVQGHGGIALEHIKSLRLHLDIGPGERLFWFTTTGWMMWNLIVSGLLVDGTVVLYDGSPSHPDLNALWALAQRHRITVFGVSAPYIHSCLKAGLRPRDSRDLSSVRVVGSTGAPLSVEGFRWIADAVDERLQVVSISGGTDLCAAFLGGAPTVPVWLGELSCPMLGAAVAAFDESGNKVIDQVGELVVTEPMPSMPVCFWNDPDGSRLRAAYFEDYPGVWRHGDWVKITPRGSAIIYGRSDSTLNRGGVRMGTADFYAVVESLDEVRDSLVIDTSSLGQEDGELLCFLVLADGATLDQVEPVLRGKLRDELSPRHVPNRFVVIPEVPRTLNGKKCEVPVKKILSGTPVEKAVSRGALANPETLEPFVALAERR